MGTWMARGGGGMSVAGRVTSRPYMYDKRRVKIAAPYSRVGRVNGLNESADCEWWSHKFALNSFSDFTQPSVNWIGDSVRIHPWMLIIHRRLKEIRKSTPCPFCFRNYFVQPSFTLHSNPISKLILEYFGETEKWQIVNSSLDLSSESIVTDQPLRMILISWSTFLLSPPSSPRLPGSSCASRRNPAFESATIEDSLASTAQFWWLSMGISGFQRRDTWNSVEWNFSSFLSSKQPFSEEEFIRVSNDFGGRMRLSEMMRAKFLRRKLNTQTSTKSLDWC